MSTESDRDSYDDDLGWILERLSERAGATGGAIVRLCEDEADSLILARYEPHGTWSPARVDSFCAAVRMARPVSGVQKLTIDLDRDERVRVLMLRFVPAPGIAIVAAICRPESSLSLLQEMIASRLEPVLARYVRLWWLHRTERRRANVFQRTIDRSDLGIVLLDRRARLRYANQSAERMLAEGDGLRHAGDGVTAVRDLDHQRLQRAVQQAIARNRAAPNFELGMTSALLTIGRGAKRALIVSVMPVDRHAIDLEDAAAVLYVLDPEHDLAGLLAPAFRIYGLTLSESRLVARLVSGADLADAAASMNLAVHTARSYLKQVFVKTATNRQAELVRVMCGSAARASVVGEFSVM